MIHLQKRITLSPKKKGFHLITDELLRSMDGLTGVDAGLAHFFIQHTSAALTINECADTGVRRDFLMAFDKLVPESWPYIHTAEGPDDMPAHIKSSLLQTSLTVPVIRGSLALGQWQGIYLCEHRESGGARHIIVTVYS